EEPHAALLPASPPAATHDEEPHAALLPASLPAATHAEEPPADLLPASPPAATGDAQHPHEPDIAIVATNAAAADEPSSDTALTQDVPAADSENSGTAQAAPSASDQDAAR
ncbi:hypothetical protein JZM24_00005, partial [Candidatus Sodalis endolongispinus]